MKYKLWTERYFCAASPDSADRQSWSVSAGFGLCGGMIVSDLATSQ